MLFGGSRLQLGQFLLLAGVLRFQPAGALGLFLAGGLLKLAQFFLLSLLLLLGPLGGGEPLAPGRGRGGSRRGSGRGRHFLRGRGRGRGLCLRNRLAGGGLCRFGFRRGRGGLRFLCGSLSAGRGLLVLLGGGLFAPGGFCFGFGLCFSRLGGGLFAVLVKPDPL